MQAGDDGILLVDSGVSARTDEVVKALHSISPRQVTYIVTTTDRADHVGGNAKLATTGRPLAIARAAQARVFIIGFSSMLGLGGSETLYPEYIKKLKTMKVAPRTMTEHYRRAQ